MTRAAVDLAPTRGVLGYVGRPQPVRAIGFEAAAHQVKRAGCQPSRLLEAGVSADRRSRAPHQQVDLALADMDAAAVPELGGHT